MMRFKNHHFRYPEPFFLAQGVRRYACLRRHPRTHSILCGMVRFKHYHFRYPETTFSGPWCAKICVLGAPPQNPKFPRTTPEPKVVAKCVSNTTILGIQKYLFRPKVCTGMRVWGATPQPIAFFFRPLRFKHYHFRYPEHTFSGPWCAKLCVLGAPPQNPKRFLWPGAFQTPPF